MEKTLGGDLRIHEAPWSDEVADLLQLACVHATRNELFEQHKRGAQVFVVRWGGDVIGAYMLRIDTTARGHEGVIVGAAGKLAGVELITLVLPVIESQFRKVGCVSVRVHTSRSGIVRQLGNRGYDLGELVLSKTL